jgi:Na+-driven multidrug efflux pump
MPYHRIAVSVSPYRYPISVQHRLRLDGVAADILAIAAPAVLALAADPITALVDTAFVGHIGNPVSSMLRCFVIQYISSFQT